MSKILVIGGSGYVGSKLILSLEKAGHEIENFDLPKNILNVEELREAIIGKDSVWLLAALAVLTYTDEHPQETFDVNIVGTNNVARICAEEKVLLNFVSTSCIYGNSLEIPSVEDRLICPTDTYAASKSAGEYVVKMWGMSKDLDFNIIRFGTVYGQSLNRSQRGDMCIQLFLENALKGEKVRIDGGGNQNRNFVHIDDLVRGLVLITDKEIKGETINLTGNESISVNDIAEYALRFGARGKWFAPSRKDDFHDQDVSINKAERLLGWKPEISFEEGITSFYEWLKKQ